MQRAALVVCEQDVRDASRAYFPARLSDSEAAKWEAMVRDDMSKLALAAVVDARANKCWRFVRDDAPVADYMKFSLPNP